MVGLYHGKNSISIKRTKQKNGNKCFSLFFLSRQRFLKTKWIELENKDNLPDSDENMQLLSLNRVHMVIYHNSSFE